MAEISIGRVRPTIKGAFVAANAYTVLDVVTLNGSSYIAVQNVPANSTITNPVYWERIAAKGDTGAAGTNGAKGDQGVPGNTGATGQQGIQGIPGNDGQDGADGVVGNRFGAGNNAAMTTWLSDAIVNDIFYNSNGNVYRVTSPGQTENMGKWIGEQGVQGVQGMTGLKGDTGNTGAKGDKGDTGNQGIQGVAGVKGDTGNTGAKGDKGDKGDRGDTRITVSSNPPTGGVDGDIWVQV